jgi:drug/metabolite transporter (DMT)-like permease
MSEHGLLSLEVADFKGYGSGSSLSASRTESPRPKQRRRWLVTAGVVICICVLGPLNGVLFKIMYTVYGERSAMFCSTMVNFIYCLYGGVALFLVRDKVTPSMWATPQSKFAIMGGLDCLAGFLTAIAAYGTPGTWQVLLNQGIVPLTMLAAVIFLGKRSSTVQWLGSATIMAGSVVVLAPSFLRGDSDLSLVSSILFFSSNIPFAASWTYKEVNFKGPDRVHVVFLTQCVSCYQFLLGLLLLPLQQLPFFGSMTLSETASSFIQGWYCFIEADPECQKGQAGLLLWSYCLVNFVYNTAGLFLVKRESARFNAVVAAVILPLNVLVFNLPALGSFTEPFHIETISGLVVVTVGFVLWKMDDLLLFVVGEEFALTNSPLSERSQEAFYERSVALVTINK